MPMKTPTFWYPKTGGVSLLSLLLTPFSWLYGLGHQLHQKMGHNEKVDIPIICVGNLTAGGSGKTPTTIALMELVKANKIAKSAAFLTRGYGGDEEQILQKHGPVLINANRLVAAREALAENKDLLIMDDGLHNPTLHKDIKLVVIDGEIGFGNRKLLPAGPMRTPLNKGMALADAFIFLGEDRKDVKRLLPSDKPVFDATLQPAYQPDTNKNYIAFAGIAYPDKFFNFLRERLGLELLQTVSFADHHPYSEADMKMLHQKANALDATLITTEKDYVKLAAEDQMKIKYLPISLSWNDESALLAFLNSKLQGKA